MNRIIYIIVSVMGFLWANSLMGQKDQVPNDTLFYIFMGHTYQYHDNPGNKVDFRAEGLDYTRFDGVWLGGDVCSEASLHHSTLQYIDSIFDLSQPTTHWALGNHDARNLNWEWIMALTGRETFYAQYNNGITVIVMNSNLVPADCESLDKQYRIIESVCDTIEHSSHLVVLVHHGMWNNVPGLPPPSTYAQSSLKYWNANCYFRENNSFVGAVYPLFVEVKNRGIDVICVLGDMGSNGKKFEMQSDDSIQFLGCGLYNTIYQDSLEFANAPKDQVLIFEHIPSENTLNFNFHSIDSIYQVHQGKIVE